MKILVINSGSSSIKYNVFEAKRKKTRDIKTITSGIVARIGEKRPYIEHNAKGKKTHREVSASNHQEGLDTIIRMMQDKEYGVVKEISEISAVGHRCVHGGIFTKSMPITDEVIKKMEDYIPLAPLHNPPNLVGIREAKKLLPNVLHVAVFDTAFHQTMPAKAYLYALPYQYYEKYGIRRYGFHGTSHRYVSDRAANLLGMPLDELKMVTCHLGNGASLTAIDKGRVIDTSMGFTPLEGVMMGTRSGDMDLGIVFFLGMECNLQIDEIDTLLNRKSGLLGISGTSNDMREILKKARGGDKRCMLAIDMFVYRVKKYIGAYATALGGLDVIVFTAGIGEKSPKIRSKICKNSGHLGIEIDEKKNSEMVGEKEGVINTSGSKVKVLVVLTDEERMIALDTLKILEETQEV